MTAVVSRPQQSDYAELKRRIKQAGLLERQPTYYTFKILLTLGALAVGLALIVLVHHIWFQVLNAVFMAFVFGQVGFLAHDGGHKQIFRNGRWNDIFCISVMNLLMGGSAGWWIDKHNAHHSNPNHLDLDPDITLPVVAFDERQAVTKRGFFRWMVKYQAYLLFPLLTFEFYSLRVISVKFLILRRSKYRALEAVVMLLHYPLFFGLVFWQLGLGLGIVFLLIQQGLTGLYIGSTFAPNHKGMPVVDDESQLDFVRSQVLTSRNLTRSRLGDFLFGSLSTQIEHHLFPSMPRNKVRQAEPIVKAFCRERSIEYYETGIVQAFREIVQHLHEVSAPLRQPGR